MADITLINLNMLFLRHYDGVERERHLPLGSLYLTAALEEAGYEVDFRDYQQHVCDDPFDPQEIAAFCSDPAPVIGLSCMANLLPFTILAAKAIRERYLDRLIVLGGVGAKAVETQILDSFPWIDAVAHGEGERTIVDLLAAHKNGGSIADVKGLAVRIGINDRARVNPPQDRVRDLTLIKGPAYDHIDVNAYEGYGMITSRGCPYPCTFCSVAPIWNHESYSRDPAHLIGEMKMLNEEAGVDLFLFQDEFFVSSKKQVVAFCDALDKSGLKVHWKAFGRINLTDTETMDRMAETGCVEIRYGIESASQKVLARTLKGFSPDQAVAVVSEAVKRFPRVDTFFVWGFPFETMEDFYQTLFQMLSFRLMGARILPSLLCYLPQTGIYQEYKGDPKFEFCPDLLPEYMLTGHEVCHSSGVEIDDDHRWLFDFITEHPDIFPGFYHYDLEGNVRPKLAVLQEHGFYAAPEPESDEEGIESCGAHSPRVATDPKRQLLTRPDDFPDDAPPAGQ